MAVVNAGIAFIQGYNSSVRFLASLYLTFSFGRNYFVYEIFCAHLFPSFLCSFKSYCEVESKFEIGSGAISMSVDLSFSFVGSYMRR